MLEWKDQNKTVDKSNNEEEINQKILVKEGKLKRYRDWIKQYNQNWT